MRNYFAYFTLFLLYASCKDKDLIFKIEDTKFEVYPTAEYKNKKTIITYSLENLSDVTYYFCPSFEANTFKSKLCIAKNELLLRIFKKGSKEVVYHPIFPARPSLEGMDCYNFIDSFLNKKLNYFGYEDYSPFFYRDYKGFFIHPNEKVYFEEYFSISNLDDTNRAQPSQVAYADIEKNIDYFAQLSITSDSTNYHKYLPRNILKTIKANNIKIYHGVITSQNKVRVKVLKD